MSAITLATYLAFFASLAGMLMSALFGSPRARDAIAAAWVAVSELREKPLEPPVRQIADSFVAALLLTKDGGVSKVKTLALAFLSSFSYGMALTMTNVESSTTPWYVLVSHPFVAGMFFLPVHWLAELVVANVLVTAYRRCATRALPKTVAILVLAWAVSVVFASIVVLALALLLGALAAYFISDWAFTGPSTGEVLSYWRSLCSAGPI